ncbi:MAG: hypothetical protein KJ964_03945 [Verrucomicrobia bacterium]|nr:hypothetical protein [Verrucomicrobiota bacterium]MBU1736030.1 hypothetical protein [Verrucomicrobiota bacterium]MBU1858126.1 hypothetical protein [Verrucomicrobiota bacterium]
MKKIEKAVKLPTVTTLVAKGAANVEILHPDSAAGKAGAEKIAGTIKAKSNVRVTTRIATKADQMPKGNVIMLGNIANNPALLLLYSRYLLTADENFPGTGGYTLETVVEPIQRGADVLVIGASDDAGLGQGVEVLCAKIAEHGKAGELVLPIIFEQKLEKSKGKATFAEDHFAKGMKDAQHALDGGKHMSLGGVLAEIGDRYRAYHNSADARLYVAVAKLFGESAINDPRKFGGPWGFDSDFASYNAIAGWDVIEHDVAISDADRLAAANVLLRWLREDIFDEAKHAASETGVLHNHTTFATLGSMRGAFYFDKYYPELGDPANWKAAVKKIFTRQTASGKVLDDSDGYLWHTWRHMMIYTLAMPDYTMLENGVAKKMVTLNAITCDNLGAQAPYGDTGGWASGNGDLIVLDMYYSATKDPMAAYLLKLKRPRSKAYGVSGFFNKIKAERQTAVDGLQIIPLDQTFYDSVECFELPVETCFDKFSFREKFSPEALYVLVDGMDTGSHRHADANSILRYSQYGRDWLAENFYSANQQKCHNSMLILCDGEAFDLPGYVEILSKDENDKFAYVAGRAKGTAPADWIRYCIWLKDAKALLVIDEAIAQKSGNYRFSQKWHTIGDIALQNNGARLVQNGPAMQLKLDVNNSVISHQVDDGERAKGWAKYPYAKPIINIVTQTSESKLDKGDKIRLLALWHGDENGKLADSLVKSAKDGVVYQIGDSAGKITINDKYQVAIAYARTQKIPRAVAKTDSASNWAQCPVLTRNWSYRLDNATAPNRLVKYADSYLVGAKDGRLLQIDNSGKLQSTINTRKQINDLAVLDLNDDNVDEILVAGDDGVIRAIDTNGKKVWDFEAPFYRIQSSFSTIRLVDLGGDGKMEIVAGNQNWHTYAIGRDGKELWKFEVVHPVRTIEVADIDGDGKNEIVSGTKYYWITVLDNLGNKRWGGGFGRGFGALGLPKVDQKSCSVVAGCDDGKIDFYNFAGEKIAVFSTGYQIAMIATVKCADTDVENVLVASQNGFVYCFTSSGKRLWSRPLAGEITVLRTTADGGAIVGNDAGEVWQLGNDGKVLAYCKTDGKIKDILVDANNAVVATGNGKVESLNLLKERKQR